MSPSYIFPLHFIQKKPFFYKGIGENSTDIAEIEIRYNRNRGGFK